MKLKNNWFYFFFLFMIIGSCNQNLENIDSSLSNFNKIVNGKKEGKHVYFINDSTLYAILNYNNDNFDGECVWYHPNGKISSKVNYVNGKEEGMAYYFYESGVVQNFRMWKEGRKVGYATDYYDEYSRVKSAMIYTDEGILIYEKTYDEDGNIISEEGEIPDAFIKDYFNNLKSGDISELFH